MQITHCYIIQLVLYLLYKLVPLAITLLFAGVQHRYPCQLKRYDRFSQSECLLKEYDYLYSCPVLYFI